VESSRSSKRCESTAVLNQAIETAFAAHEEAWLFSCPPEAGPAPMPSLRAAFGTNRGRWQHAHGLPPFSGNNAWVHCRFACPGFARRNFHEFAAHSIQRAVWARTDYGQPIGAGKKHPAAVRYHAADSVRLPRRVAILHRDGSVTLSGVNPVRWLQQGSDLPPCGLEWAGETGCP
jgi:hypothetical protein